MTVDESVHETAANSADAASLEDGRTRCAWVRGRPEHYLFHDAEWGRLPDSDAACFERLLLTCFERDHALVDVLDQRADVYEALGEWDVARAAGLGDADLDAAATRGGIFGDRARLGWVRDVAKAAADLGKEYKGLRNFFLAMPALLPDEQIDCIIDCFPGFEKEDAARLVQMVGCVGGSIEQWSHERDCWIY